MTLPAFSSYPSGDPVYINPLRVTVVKRYAPGRTLICFELGNSEDVTEAPDQVAAKLWAALKATG